MTPTFDNLIQDFFCHRLIQQQGVSPRTVEAYRDTFRLLLAYLPLSASARRCRKPRKTREKRDSQRAVPDLSIV